MFTFFLILIRFINNKCTKCLIIITILLIFHKNYKQSLVYPKSLLEERIQGDNSGKIIVNMLNWYEAI
ncbi:hypothetical protein D7X33_27615 [Butyricicoccus sp. 1XD8-22]|nr:hypothetical protein D7X33_27615 [Butyricicoccus sp. 1XD8-22]